MDNLPSSKKRILLLVCAFLLLFTIQVQAATPENLNYQGKLKDSGGIPITTATTIQFSIYNNITTGLPSDVPSAVGPLLWTEIYDQGVGNCMQIDPDAEGIFGQRLGTCVSFPAYMDFTDEYYIGVKVGADGEATPRIPLSSNPYAHTAGGLFGDSEDVNIETENSGNVVFNSAGNVQMTSNDVTPALIINQIGTGSLFEVQDNGVTSFVILDGGNVGIGTDSPRVALEIGDGAGEGDGAILATGVFDEGWTEPDLGEGTRMLWYPRKAAFRAGYVDGTQWDNGNIGEYSFAVGESTMADGDAAVAMGRESTASGSYSIAMGHNTSSSGVGSIAMGSGATSTMDGSIAIGHNTSATHDGATAMGYDTTASGHFSTALGQGTTASGDWATAIGSGIEASSTYTIAIGLDNMTGTNCNQANSLCIMGGEVGIGTIAPTASLHLNPATATRSQFRLESSAGTNPTTPNSGDLWWNGTELYFFDGTLSNDLLAGGSGSTTFLALTDTPMAYTAGSVLFTSGSGVTEDNANLFWDDTTDRLGIGTNAPRQTLDITGNIITDFNDRFFGTWHGDGSNFRLGFDTDVGSRVTNIHSYSSDGLGSIGFSTGTVGSPSERMRITNGGYVGIGTGFGINPRQRLEVVGNIITDWSNRSFGTWHGDGSSYRLGFDTDIIARDTNIHAYTDDGNGSIIFSTGTVGSPSEGMRIENSGNVGIGTSTPSTTLHINSNAVNATALLTLANTAGDFQFFRVDATPESSVAGSIGDLTVDGTNGDLYIKASGDGTNTGWERLALATEVTGGSTSISKTVASYSGSFSSGGYVGYQAANDICNSEFPGSHFCRTDEIIQFIAEHSIAGFAADAWIAEGPPGYTSNSNDCSGWTNNGTAQLGAYWAYDSTGGGKGWLVSCETTLPLSCCQ